MREPQIWSHITDMLPEDHPLAYKTLICTTCRNMVHAGNNECMRTWVETGNGPYCIECFVKAPVDVSVLEEHEGWGLA